MAVPEWVRLTVRLLVGSAPGGTLTVSVVVPLGSEIVACAALRVKDAESLVLMVMAAVPLGTYPDAVAVIRTVSLSEPVV